ncbi:MAG TPA: hypothetical protein VF095_04945 [Bacillota bacterium]
MIECEPIIDIAIHLRHLKQQPTKDNFSFMREITHEQIPIDKDRMIRAFQLVKIFGHHGE